MDGFVLVRLCWCVTSEWSIGTIYEMRFAFGAKCRMPPFCIILQ